MLLFEDSRYIWRETYFVVCEAVRRPDLASIERGLRKALPRLELRVEEADTAGRLIQLSLISDENHSGVDILWTEGESVHAEIVALLDELVKHAPPATCSRLNQARQATAKVELLHYELLDRASTGPPRPRKEAATDTRRLPESTTESKRETESGTENSPPASPKVKRFAFDPERYIEPPKELDTGENDAADFLLEEYDSAVLMPDTLILATETIRRLTGGIAIDPASGSVF